MMSWSPGSGGPSAAGEGAGDWGVGRAGRLPAVLLATGKGMVLGGQQEGAACGQSLGTGPQGLGLGYTGVGHQPASSRLLFSPCN
jgi:hypothetical protein